MNREILDRRYTILALILGMMLLTAPHYLRIGMGNTNLMGDSPYRHIAVVENMNGLLYTDAASGGSTHIVNPYQIMLSAGKENLELFSRIIPITLGMLSLLLILLILERMKLERLTKDIFLFITVLSPLFISTFSQSTESSLALFLMLLGFFLFMSKSRLSFIASSSILLIIPFFGVLEATVMAVSIIAYWMNDKEFRQSRGRYRLIIALGILTLSTTTYTYLSYTLMEGTVRATFIDSGYINNLISDFGGKEGIGIFKLMLVFLGLMTIWKDKDDNWMMIILLLGSVIATFFDEAVIIYASLIFTYFACIGIKNMIGQRWETEFLKYLTLMTIVSGLLFSTVSYINTFSKSPPDEEMVKSLEWMRENLEDGKVLSHYSNGYWIEAIAKKEVVMDAYIYNNPRINIYYNSSQEIFESRNLEKTLEMLKEKDVRYIWIDKRMKESLVWEREEEGLLFLLKNDKTFITRYIDQGVQIYEIDYDSPI